MKMYNGEVQMHGKLKYDYEELTGNGLTEFNNAVLKSTLFVRLSSLFPSVYL